MSRLVRVTIQASIYWGWVEGLGLGAGVVAAFHAAVNMPHPDDTL